MHQFLLINLSALLISLSYRIPIVIVSAMTANVIAIAKIATVIAGIVVIALIVTIAAAIVIVPTVTAIVNAIVLLIVTVRMILLGDDLN